MIDVCHQWLDLRLVDDPHDIETGDGSGILGGLALGIVEVSRDSDHGMGDLQRDERKYCETYCMYV